MRHQWYGDHRDLVKWGTVFHLAATKPTTVLYVPMLTPDDPKPSAYKLGTGSSTHPLPLSVLSFFRDVAHIKRLPWPADTTFVMIEGSMENRAPYFARVSGEIRRASPLVRRLVVVDPDTGIAPAGGGGQKHVKPAELHDLFAQMQAGDLLAVYQHAWRDKAWLIVAKSTLADAVGVPASAVTAYECAELASDVAMLTVEKT